MATNPTVERFVGEAGLEHGPMWLVHDAIAAEVGDQLLATVLVGEDGQGALMCARDDGLAFYTLSDDRPVPLVSRVEVRSPSETKVTVVRNPAHVSSSQPRTFHVQMLIAEHDSLPGNRVECDVSGLWEDATTPLRELFESWK